LKTDLRFRENMKLPEHNLEIPNPHQFFKYCFFTEEFFPKIVEETILYSSQINPNKAMNSTVYGTQKFHGICIISSLNPPPVIIIFGMTSWAQIW
jgi:hypothetical protein